MKNGCNNTNNIMLLQNRYPKNQRLQSGLSGPGYEGGMSIYKRCDISMNSIDKTHDEFSLTTASTFIRSMLNI